MTSKQAQITNSKQEKKSLSSSSTESTFFIKLTGELANQVMSDYSTEEFNCIKSYISSNDEIDTSVSGDDFEKS